MTDVHEIIENGLFSSAVAVMDNDIREAVHRDLAPCTVEEFLIEYAKRHYDKYGEQFEI